MRFFDRIFPAQNLDAVGTGRNVSMQVTVVGPNMVSSSISPVEAVAIRWSLLYETHRIEGGGGGRVERRSLNAFLVGWHGESLMVRAACGRMIEVATRGAQLVATVDPQDGTPLGSTPESGRLYAELAQRGPRDVGMVYVREHCITAGQTLHLKAFVEPVTHVGGYRDAQRPEHAFDASREVVMRDL